MLEQSATSSLTYEDLLISLRDEKLDVLNFLNEVMLMYPEAISFCSGRPSDQFCYVENLDQKLDLFLKTYSSLIEKNKFSACTLGQYSKTKGIISDHIALMLEKDEGIKTLPDNIIITVGFQEAISLCLMTLFNKECDVLLCEDPTFVGIIGIAKLLGIQIVPIPFKNDQIDLNILDNNVYEINKNKKRVKALYVTPDFNNPTGNCMSYENRKSLLRMANKYNFFSIHRSQGVIIFNNKTCYNRLSDWTRINC